MGLQRRERKGLVTSFAGGKIPPCRTGTDLAIRFPVVSTESRSARLRRETAATSHSRNVAAKSDARCRAEIANRQEGELPYAASQLRDASARQRHGYPHGSGITGACGRVDDDDLYARPATRCLRSSELARPTLNAAESHGSGLIVRVFVGKFRKGEF